ncbi:hypothetical protein ADK87_23130 [Streptomyces sp. NRRL F-4711]|uniref:hypothetical protein n=1 Tax=unclassified Streptomyces TaxID=2593676 RepID=UPI0004C21E70|nr:MULTISPECIES: hypothetical protein [unclassified Streptomyces]KOT96458.1 hypothetical protein ADK87_23130 [Streptomyces sp. NRRL F-4711]
MPQHVSTARICRDCDGFPMVAITTGTRHTDGTRVTLRITCPTCQGTGTTTPAASLIRAGR